MEIFFEPFCVEHEGEYQPKHDTGEIVTSAGVVGFRGADKGNSRYYDHMSGSEVRALMGVERWHEYFKFTTIRNPFEKLVSGFYWRKRKLHKLPYLSSYKKIRHYVNTVLKRTDPIYRVKEEENVAAFREWIQIGGGIGDSYILSLIHI